VYTPVRLKVRRRSFRTLARITYNRKLSARLSDGPANALAVTVVLLARCGLLVTSSACPDLDYLRFARLSSIYPSMAGNDGFYAPSGLCVSNRQGLGQYCVQPDALCRRTTKPCPSPFRKIGRTCPRWRSDQASMALRARVASIRQG
jgi:hypothetical protein